MTRINKEKAVVLYKKGKTYEEISKVFGVTKQAVQYSISKIIRLRGIERKGSSTEERFWSKVDKTDTCWLWISYIDPHGYGKFSHKGVSVYAHRYSLGLKQILNNTLVIDHLCRVRCCVNPGHLEQVTLKENIYRSPKHIVHGDFRKTKTLA